MEYTIFGRPGVLVGVRVDDLFIAAGVGRTEELVGGAVRATGRVS